MTPEEAARHEWLQPSANASYNHTKAMRERQQENSENQLISPKTQKFQRAQRLTPLSNTVLPEIKTPNKFNNQKIYKERTKGIKHSSTSTFLYQPFQ